jgi:hypothetical protein
MNTLEEAQAYFQSKGYNADFLFGKQEGEPLQLTIRGRRGFSETLGLLGYRSAVLILFTDNRWKLEHYRMDHYRLLLTFEHLSDAVAAAEANLGPPIEPLKKEMTLLEDAHIYFQVKGYHAEIFEDDYPPKLLVLGRQISSAPNFSLIRYCTEVFILMTMDTVWHLKSPVFKEHSVQSTFKTLQEAVAAAEVILGPPVEPSTDA